MAMTCAGPRAPAKPAEEAAPETGPEVAALDIIKVGQAVRILARRSSFSNDILCNHAPSPGELDVAESTLKVVWLVSMQAAPKKVDSAAEIAPATPEALSPALSVQGSCSNGNGSSNGNGDGKVIWDETGEIAHIACCFTCSQQTCG